MWAWVWVVLVLGALVFLGWIGWKVVRSATNLVRTAAQAGRRAGEATDRISEAVAQAEALRTTAAPTMFDDPTDLHARVSALRAARRAKQRERQVRRRAVWQTWTASTWLERRRAERSSAR